MLEENGFIARKRSASDKRAIEVYPTEKCNAILPLIRESFADWKRELTAEMSEDELEILEALTEKLAKRAKEIE